MLHGLFSSDFQPLTGTYAALVGTGDLRLVRTDSLRPLLVAYAARMESERQSLETSTPIGLGAVDVFPRQLPFARTIFLDKRDRPRGPPFDFAAVRDDPDVAALLFRLQASNVNRVTHLRRLPDQTRRLRRALELETGSGLRP